MRCTYGLRPGRSCTDPVFTLRSVTDRFSRIDNPYLSFNISDDNDFIDKLETVLYSGSEGVPFNVAIANKYADQYLLFCAVWS